jgi:hypothetical protein
MKDIIDRLIDYESGLLSDGEVIALFQDLIDSRLAWQLQGHYGRTATQLIEAGYCTDPNGSASSEEALEEGA